MKAVALIPARSQSKRIPHKNIYPLQGHPLLAYSIQAAKDSGIFDGIYLSSDSEEIGEIGKKYGAEFIHCPLSIAHKDNDSDIRWVAHALKILDDKNYEAFSILRPTSPFRTGETIKRAWAQFSCTDCDSLRAVEKCSQHPYKMWVVKGAYMMTLIDSGMHSQPYQNLPVVYAQNASLEIAHCYVVYSLGSISGTKILPFFTQGYEGFDINYPRDLREAEYLIKSGEAMLPKIL